MPCKALSFFPNRMKLMARARPSTLTSTPCVTYELLKPLKAHCSVNPRGKEGVRVRSSEHLFADSQLALTSGTKNGTAKAKTHLIKLNMATGVWKRWDGEEVRSLSPRETLNSTFETHWKPWREASRILPCKLGQHSAQCKERDELEMKERSEGRVERRHREKRLTVKTLRAA